MPAIAPSAASTRLPQPRPRTRPLILGWLPILALGMVLPALASEGRPGPEPSLAGAPDGPRSPPRRVERKEVALRPSGVRERLRDGKTEGLDPERGTFAWEHLVDALPEDWRTSQAPATAGAPKGVDSLGRPIVNEVLGWPGWAAADVDALLAEIRRAARVAATADAHGRAEAEAVLGNFVGQALVRGIALEGLVDVERLGVELPEAAEAAVDQLRVYEAARATTFRRRRTAYAPSSLSPQARALVHATGRTVTEALAGAAGPPAIAKTAPSGCYVKETFPRGLTLLAGATVLWSANDTDDASADVGLGFLSHYGYGCAGTSGPVGRNTTVRVSTNGYATLFQQGGGALAGTDYTNDPIPSGNDPDFFMAPSWDDYAIRSGSAVADQVSYKTEGALGERVFTAEWKSVSHVGGNGLDSHTFQLKVFETTGVVELLYDTTWAASAADAATIGIENADGTRGDCGPSCDATIVDDGSLPNLRLSPVRPSNDDDEAPACLWPIAGFNPGRSTYGATGEDLTPDYAQDQKDVWFRYHSPNDGTLTVDTCDTDPSIFETTLAVFEPNVDFTDFTLLAAAGSGCPFNGSAQITLEVEAGEDYAVRVAGKANHEGAYKLSARQFPLTASFNSCDAAKEAALPPPVGFESSTSDNFGCSDHTPEIDGDTIAEWIRVVAPATAPYRLTTCHPRTDFDTTLAVFASCGSAPIAVNDDDERCGVHRTHSTVTWWATEGTAYWFRVSGWGGAHGTYHASWSREWPLFADGFESGDTSAW